MSAALHLVASNGGRVAAIWLLLVLSAVLALAGLALPSGVRRPRQVTAWLTDSARHKREAVRRKASEAEESIRYAGEVSVAANRAALTAERHRDQCQQAQAAVEVAWQHYQKADSALGRARLAAAYATPESLPSEADREQSLRRSAQAAYRRGDLSDTQLLDALTHRNGWDAKLHPIEQELVLARAAVTHRFEAYQDALVVEQEAWRASDVATASVHSLRREATLATARAEVAEADLVPVERSERRRQRVPVAA